MKREKKKEIAIPPSPRRIRFKACVAMVCVLLLPLFGLVLGALLDHIIAGLVAGQLLGLALTLLLSYDMPKNPGLSFSMGFGGGVLAYLCSTVAAQGKPHWALLLMGVACGVGISFVLPALQELGR